MIVPIDKDFKIQDIEEEFSLFFPFLKIELEPIAGLEEVRRTNSIELTNGMTVAGVRQLFRNELQMFLKIFRSKNDEWIEIPEDSFLTLKEENEAGRKASNHLIKKPNTRIFLKPNIEDGL